MKKFYQVLLEGISSFSNKTNEQVKTLEQGKTYFMTIKVRVLLAHYLIMKKMMNFGLDSLKTLFMKMPYQ